VNLKALGERTIIVDCDVIQADGGTRAASITGGFVALALALRQLVDAGLVDQEVFGQPVAAVSVGLVEGKALLDLCYEEDSRAEADFSVVMNAAEEFVEIQGTAERRPFTREHLDELLGLAQRGIRQLLGLQQRVLRG
jgi:ribonuclease PH